MRNRNALLVLGIARRGVMEALRGWRSQRRNQSQSEAMGKISAALLEVKVAVVLQSAHVHLISGHEDEVDDFLDGFAVGGFDFGLGAGNQFFIKFSSMI